MNTKQLIIFWYAGLVLIIALLSSLPYTEFRDLIISISSILLLTFLLYLTFRDSEKIKSKTVIYSAVLPLSLIVMLTIGLAWIINTNAFATQIPEDEIEVFDLNLNFEKKPYYGREITLNGRLKNNSKYSLGTMKLRIRIHELIEKSDSLDESAILFLNTNAQIDNLSKKVKEKVGRIIDTEILKWSDYTGLKPGETKSFTANKDISTIRPTQSWVWSYEIISATSE